MPSTPPSLAPFLESVIDRINVGIFIVDSKMEIVLWNNFMEVNSGQTAETVIGRNLFDCFPDLPRAVLENKIRGVFILKNFAFSSWEQRPYLFKFRHNRPVTGGIVYMCQDCTLIPIKNDRGEVEKVCVTLIDTTDTAIRQKMLKAALESLAEANHRDGLTGIYDRHFLEESLAREFSRARRYGGTISLAMLDIDHFKLINETYGHLAGDAVLPSMANCLSGNLRETDTLGRYGGEEFGLLMPETNLNYAYILVDRMRAQIAELTTIYSNIRLKLTISAGVAEYHTGMIRYEELINAASDALQHAKETGRNRVICAQQPTEARDTLRASGSSSS